MTSHGARNNRSVATNTAQNGYPSEQFTKRVYARHAKHEKRTCAQQDCDTKLSFYNDTNYCSKHQKDHITSRNFI